MSPGNEKYLNLLRELTLAQIKLKGQNSALGLLWNFFHPLLMLVTIFLVFHVRFGDEIEHYGIFVLIGMVQYTHFVNCTSAAMVVFSNMSQLTKQAVFPKELLVFSVVLARTAEYLISLGVATAIGYVAGIPFSWSILALPAVVILQLTFVMWVSLTLSWVFLLIRDTQHLYQVFLRLLLFISPIFYPLSFLGEGSLGAAVVQANPMTHLIGYGRTLIIAGDFLPLNTVVLFLAANLALAYLLYHLFRRMEPHFAELV